MIGLFFPKYFFCNLNHSTLRTRVQITPCKFV